MNHIALLDPLVARRIAAGEVVERPASVVRELVDNAIDAAASSITVTLQDGGTSEVSVIDDGEGIAREDLPLCCASHATSKVRTLDDLYTVRSMGFRGEALYSISSVSRLTISSRREGEDGATITVDNGKSGSVESGGVEKGTKVTVSDLFLDIPARRQFLKRPGTETMMCRSVLLEKALAYPSIAFRLVSDGKLLLSLDSAGAKERVLSVLSGEKKIDPAEMRELDFSAERFSLHAITSTAALFRGDRSGIKIFINKRPVEDYALTQAVTYGYGEMLPGGSYPYCCLFITVDPTLVDFNIHPTKREARLRNKTEVHHGITAMFGSGLKRIIPRMVLVKTDVAQGNLTPTDGSSRRPGDGSLSVSSPTPPYRSPERRKEEIDPSWFEKAREILSPSTMVSRKETEENDSWLEARSGEEFTYIGQAFKLFLIAEKGDEIYLVDQHAAHERILFDEIRAKKDVQNLLVPLEFETERDCDEFLSAHGDLYQNLGIRLERKGPLLWSMLTIPALFRNIESTLVDFISHESGDEAEIEKGLYAVIACHKAIKQGETVDRMTAEALLEKVFAMKEPVCPHGRTFVIRLRKQDLIQAIGRT